MLNDYIAGFAVPTILLFAGVFSKKLVRGKGGWLVSDFYLGVELTLGALTSGLLHIFDVLKSSRSNPLAANTVANLSYTSIYLVVTFMMFLFVLSLHQIWEGRKNGRAKWFNLGVVANFVGFGLMVAFFLFVKGVH